jgi:ankyrin repeat protein
MDIFEATTNDNLALIKKALKKESDINTIETEEGEPYLLFAIGERVDLDTIKYLVEYGFDTAITTMEGMGFLDYMVSFGGIEHLRYAVEELGFDVNETQRRSGFLPIMQAACYGQREMVIYLCEHGADLGRRDASDMNVIDYAKKTGQKKMAELLETLQPK